MRFQSAFIAVAVLAASLGVADDNLDESKAIQKIEMLRGSVKRDETLPGRPVVRVTFFRRSKHFSGRYLHLLKSFKELNTLTRITGTGLKQLSELKQLAHLTARRHFTERTRFRLGRQPIFSLAAFPRDRSQIQGFHRHPDQPHPVLRPNQLV